MDAPVFCLARAKQSIAPNAGEKSQLQVSGLGEKKLCLSPEGDTSHVDAVLKFEFPQLSDTGGYTLMACEKRRGSVLIPFHPPYYVENLGGSVNFGRIYIKPLQETIIVHMMSFLVL